MSIHDGTFQESVITALEEQGIIESAIIEDIIAEHLERKTLMEYLDKRSRRLPADNWYEDYLSTQFNGVPIFDRVFDDELKVNHRLHNDFFNRIASTFTGYMGNEISIKWDEREIQEIVLKEAQKRIAQFDKRNNMNAKYHEILNYDVKQGTGYLLLYQKNAELMAKSLKPWECVIIRNQSTNEVDYAMRYWKAESKVLDMNGQITTQDVMIVEWYDKDKVTYFIESGDGTFVRDEINHPVEQKMDANGKMYMTDPAEMPHFMGFVPIIEFPKNIDRIGDCEKSLELQDAYNITISDLSAEIAQLRLSYLLIKALGSDIDSKFLKKLKQTGIIVTDETGEAKFIEKNLNAQAVMDLQDLLNKNIFLFSNSVDFSSEEFSGNMPIIAFKLKTKPLEESAKETEIYMKQALSEMYRIIANFWKVKDGFELPVDAMSFVFTRNLPVNTTEEIDNFVKIKGLLSDETALGQLSFVGDINEEMERMKNQQEEQDMRIYQNMNTEEQSDQITEESNR